MFKNTHPMLRWIGALTVLLGTATASFAQNTFATATDLTSNTSPMGTYTFTGSTTTAGGFTDDFTTVSTPGSATAQASNDVFYKVHTNGCTDQITLSTCGITTNFDTYIHLLDASGAEIASNDNSALPGCVVTAFNESGLTFAVSPGTDYYIVVEGAGTAEGDFDLNITEEDLVPLVATATSADVCEGGTIALMAGPAGATYAWTSNGAGVAYTSSMQNPSITGATNTDNTGLYEVEVTLAGCTATADVFVQVNALSTVDAGTPSAICAGTGTVNLTGSMTGATSGTWTGGGGTFSNMGAFDPIGGVVYTPGTTDLTGFVAGSKTITLTLTTDVSAAGCPAVMSTVMITLYECPDLVAASPAVTTTFCGTANIDLNTTIMDNSAATGTTTWYPTQTDAQAETAALGSSTVMPTATTTYWARKNTATSPMCTDIISTTITVNALPNVTAMASSPLSCNTPTVTLTASSTDAVAPTFEWATGVPGATRTATAIGTFTVTATGVGGCTNTAEVTTTGSLTPSGPLAGTYYIPSTCFPTIADASAYFNLNGVSANVTFEVANTHTETAPVGGINFLYLGVVPANQTTAAQTITFRRNAGAGARPVVTGGVGQGTFDAIFSIYGVDYITFDGIEVKDAVANVTATDRNEYGFYVSDNGDTDGAQHVTLQNNKITLTNQYSEAIGIYQETLFNPTTADGGCSYNKYYSNLIDNVSCGVAINGNTVNDVDNEIGAAGMGNTITNFAALTAPSALLGGVNTAIYVYAQQNVKIADNMLTGGLSTLNASITGIHVDANDGAGANPSVTVTGNTMTIVNGAAAGNLIGIRNAAGSATSATASININNNTMTGCRNYVATSGAFRGIRSTAHAANVNMNDNTINNMNPAAANAFFGTGSLIFFDHSPATADVTKNLSISGNTVQDVKLGNTSTVNLASNDPQGDVFIAATNGLIFTTTPSTGGASVSTMIQNNTFNNITYSAARGTNITTVGAGRAVVAIGDRSNNNNKQVLNNTISNITFAAPGFGMGGTDGFMGFSAGFTNTPFTAIGSSAGGTASGFIKVIGNTISNINLGNVTGGSPIIMVNPSGASAGSEVKNNTIDGVSNTLGASSVRGIYINQAPAVVDGNQVKNINTGMVQGVIAIQVPTNGSVTNNTVTNLSSSTLGVTGITANNVGITTGMTVSGNSVTNLSLTGGAGAQVTAISAGGSAASTPIMVTKNVVSGLSITYSNTVSSIRGISFGVSNCTASNNFISNLTCAATSGTSAIIALNMNTAATFKAYHNTIAIGGMPTSAAGIYTAGTAITSSGTNFGGAGIQYVGTTAAIFADIRDNVISINATGKGSGNMSAVRRSLGTASALMNNGNANLTFNNNVYYAPTAAQSYIYAEGLTAVPAINYSFSQVGACTSPYKVFAAPRESNTFVEVIPFLGTGAVPNNLKLDDNSVPASYASNGGVPVGITDDYFSAARSASSPDMGAYEYTDASSDASAPSIVFTPLANQSCPAAAITLVAAITDATGVNVTAGTAPRLYIKKAVNANTIAATNDNTTDGWKYVEMTSVAGNNYTFTFDFSLLFGGAPVTGDVINYFVAAQDLVGSPNTGASAALATCATSVNLLAANLPATGFSAFTYSAPPAGPFTTTSSSIFSCNAMSVNLGVTPTASGLSYSWYEGGVLLATTSVPTYPTTVASTNTYYVEITCSGTPIATAATVEVVIAGPSVVTASATPAAVCGASPFSLSGTASPAAATFGWFADATTNTPLAATTGLTIATTTTYYAEAQMYSPTVGLGATTANVGGTGTVVGPFIGGGGGVAFGQVINTAGAPVEIISVKVLPGGAGLIRLLLVDNSSNVIQQATATATAASNTTLMTIPTNFRVPANSTGWKVVLSNGVYAGYAASPVGIYNAGTIAPNPYPYSALSGAITMTSATFNLFTSVYMYDMQVRALCISPRTPVTVNFTAAPGAVTIATPAPACGSASTPLTAVDVASAYTTFTWSNGSTGLTNTVTPLVTTTYTVTATDGACATTASVTVTVLPTPVITATTATPAAICNPGSSVLASTTAVWGPNTYAFAETTGTYTPLVGATAAVITGTTDDGSQTPISLGFTFNYNGTAFTNFGLAVNGHVKLGNAAFPGDTWTNSLASNANIIAPMWDDNHLGTGAISYLMSGTAPNRVMTIQWAGVAIGGGGATANSTNNYQVELLEGTDVVRFNYGTLTSANGLSASIGISGAAGNFLSVTPGAPATASPSLENNAISAVTAIPTGTVYTFTPNMITYAWTATPAGFTSVLQSPGTVNPTVTTVYNLVVTNATNGCTTTASTTVTVAQPANAGTSASAPAVCNSAATTIDMTTLIGTHDMGGTWAETSAVPSTSGFTAATGEFITTGNAAGTYTFTYTVLATAPCVGNSTATVTVVINAAPVLTTSATPITCNGLTNGSVGVMAVPNILSAFTFDGNISEGAWGAALATNVGGPTPGFGGTNNLNAIYGAGDANNTYISVAGNVDNNRIMVFIDSKAGGVTNGGFDRTNAPGGANNFTAASTFPAGFAPDYCMIIGSDGGSTHYIDLFTLTTTAGGGTNTYLGGAGAVMNVAGAKATIGVTASASSLTQGYEVAIPNSLLGNTAGTVKMFAVLSGDGGYLSNMFLTHAPNTATNYGTAAVDFGAETAGAVSFTNTPVTYAWTGGATTATVNNLAAGTYTVTVTGMNGCTTTATAEVTEPAIITYAITQTNVTCGAVPVLGTIDVNTVAGGTGAYTYSFNNGVSYGASATATGLIAATYTVIVKDANGCTSTASAVIITQPVTITPTFTGAAPICTGGSITLTATGGDTYAFSGAGTVTTNTDLVAPVATTTYTVTVSDAASGCSATATQTVVVKALPTLSATTTDNTNCLSPFTGAIDLTATDPNAVVAIDGTIEAAWGTALATDAGGPSAGFGGDLVLNALYANNDGINTNIAVQGKFHYTDNPVIIFIDSKAGGVTSGAYNRTAAPTGLHNFNTANTFDAGFAPDYAAHFITNDNGATYTANLYKLDATTGSNMPLTAANFAVNAWSGVQQGAEFKIPNSALGYTGGDIKFFAMLQGGATDPVGYLSNQFLSHAGAAEGNYGAATIDFGTRTPDPVTLPAASTTFTYLWSNGAITQDLTAVADGTYTVTVTSPNGCSTTTQVVVNNNTPAIAATVTGAGALTCTTPTLTLDASTSTNANTYAWTTTGSITGSTTSATAVAAAAGDYTVVVTNTASGCQSTATVTVTGGTVTPAAAITGAGALTCTTTSLTLDASTSTGADTYAWTTSGSITGAANAATAVAAAAGDYTVVVTNTASGCQSTATVTVTSSATAPVATVTGAGALTCTANTLTLDASTSTGGTTYAWTTAGGSITGLTNGATITAAAAGDYTVVYTNTTTGCVSSATVTVTGGTLTPVATVTGGGSILSCASSVIILDASTSTNADTYAWTTTTGTIAGSTSAATANATLAGDYTVVVTNTASGCQSTATVTVTGAVNPTTNVALTVMDQTAIPNECDGGVWTYYGNPTDGSSDVFFAIKWNSNAAAKTTATVSINVGSGTDVTDATSPQRTWTMDRQWDVQNAGTNDFTADPVSVRFYYNPADNTNITNLATAYLATISSQNPTYVVEPLTWFHAATAGGTFTNNGAGITGAEAIVGVPGQENGVDYIEFAGITHFSGGTAAVGVGPAANPLPVKLISFTGAINGKVNELTWKTATEQNVASFIVERSTNGTTDFKAVGSSVAPTNTNVEHTYRLTDTDPTSRAYYRLRMTDLDGTVAHSDVVTLVRRSGDFAIASVFPNPTNGIVNVEYDVATATTVNFVVIDVLGRVMTTVKTQATPGLNVQKLDLADFASGVYTIIMDKGTTERVVRKVVKE